MESYRDSHCIDRIQSRHPASVAPAACSYPTDCRALTSLNFDSSVVVSVKILVSSAESAVDALSPGLSSTAVSTFESKGNNLS